MEKYAKSKINSDSMLPRAKENIDQNLNHPAKFEAVYEIIASGELDHLHENGENTFQFVERKIDGPMKNHLINYKIRPGDSLWRLSQQFQTPIEKIKKRNGLKSNTIKPGQVLRIKTSAAYPNLEHYAKSAPHMKRLEKLNPAVKNPQAPLPDGFTIRM